MVQYLVSETGIGKVFDEVVCAKPLSRIEDYDRFTTWWSEMQQSRMIPNVTTTMRTTSKQGPFSTSSRKRTSLKSSLDPRGYLQGRRKEGYILQVAVSSRLYADCPRLCRLHGNYSTCSYLIRLSYPPQNSNGDLILISKMGVSDPY